MFSSVVLPAPLGPITESRSPWLTSTLTLLTACTPPNDLETSRTSRRALMHSREPALPPAVVLHVAVALTLPDAGEPQIELLDVLVVADGAGVAVEHDATRFHHVAVLGVLEGDGGVLLGEQDRDLFFPVEPTHDLEDFCHQHGGEPHRWLVQQHQARAGHQRAPDGEHLLLAARNIPGLGGPPL